MLRAASFLLLLVLAIPAMAEERSSLPQNERVEIRFLVQNQIDAIRNDDGQRAFSYAAPRLKERFSTPDAYLDMMKRSYQPVYRLQSYAFGATMAVDQGAVQDVRIVGPDGSDWNALYLFERQGDGHWKIAGCLLSRGGTTPI